MIKLTSIPSPYILAVVLLLSLLSVDWSLTRLFLTEDHHGRFLMWRGDFSGAARVFNDPFMKGTALYRNGDFKGSALYFGYVSSPEGNFNQGNAFLMAGKYDDAINSFERAIENRPQWKEAKKNLAIAIARKDKMKPPEDDAGGTGGMLEADKIVFGDRKPQDHGDNKEEVEAQQNKSDEEVRALWLRRIQTRPADFLAAKFSYQNMESKDQTKGREEG